MKLRIKTPQYNSAYYAILLPAEIKLSLVEFKTFYNIDVPEEIRKMLRTWINNVENELNLNETKNKETVNV